MDTNKIRRFRGESPIKSSLGLDQQIHHSSHVPRGTWLDSFDVFAGKSISFVQRLEHFQSSYNWNVTSFQAHYGIWNGWPENGSWRWGKQATHSARIESQDTEPLSLIYLYLLFNSPHDHGTWLWAKLIEGTKKVVDEGPRPFHWPTWFLYLGCQICLYRERTYYVWVSMFCPP